MPTCVSVTACLCYQSRRVATVSPGDGLWCQSVAAAHKKSVSTELERQRKSCSQFTLPFPFSSFFTTFFPFFPISPFLTSLLSSPLPSFLLYVFLPPLCFAGGFFFPLTFPSLHVFVPTVLSSFHLCLPALSFCIRCPFLSSVSPTWFHVLNLPLPLFHLHAILVAWRYVRNEQELW